MKKAGLLVAVVGLLGSVSMAFAQGSPSVDAITTGMAMAGVSANSKAHVEAADATSISKNVTQQSKKANFLHNILAQREIDLSYRLETHVNPGCQMISVPDCDPVTLYPTEGTFPGRVYQHNNVNYILVSANVWNAIDDMTSINWFTDTFGGRRIVRQTFVTTDGTEYSCFGHLKLNASSVMHQGRELMIISFPVAKNQ